MIEWTEVRGGVEVHYSIADLAEWEGTTGARMVHEVERGYPLRVPVMLDCPGQEEVRYD